MQRNAPKTNSILTLTKYDIQFQSFLLSQIFGSGELYSRCKAILKPAFFDKEFKNSIQYVNEYTDKHNGTMPTLLDIEMYADFKFQDIKVDEPRHQAVLDSAGQFCKHKALALAVQESMELVNKKEYGGIEALIKEAMLVTIQNDLGLNIYENPEEVIETQKQKMATFKTGWETLDYKLFGGFGRQELEIFAAQSGGGKSVVMQNLAINFSRDGKHGAYITLELAEELVATRIYGMMVDQSQRIVKDASGAVSLAICTESKMGNADIHVKRMPESISTVNDIESYLRELQIKTEKKLDYVCVDYLDLLTSDRCAPSDRSNAFVKDKFVSEELRAMAAKLDVTVITACQFNRSGVAGEDVRSQAQIAGGISKVYTADNLIFIETRKENNELWFDFQKSRNSSAVGSRLRMAYSMDSLRIFDHEMTVDELSSTGAFPFKHSDMSKVRSRENVNSPVRFSSSSTHPIAVPVSQPIQTVQSVQTQNVLSTSISPEPELLNTGKSAEKSSGDVDRRAAIKKLLNRT